MQQPNPTSGKSGHYFFEEVTYPAKWENWSDKKLIRLFQRWSKRDPDHPQKLLLLCYLMKRHQAAIIAISFRFLRNEDAVREFTHELFEKLCVKLPGTQIQHFGGFLSTIVRNMHLDKKKKLKKIVDISEVELPENGKGSEYELIMRLDNPLTHEKLDQYLNQNVISRMEYECIKLILVGLKSGEIAKIIDPTILGMQEHTSSEPEEEYFQRKRKKVFDAVDRARRKLRKHLS